MKANTRPSQADKILRYLQAEVGSWNKGWVSMPDLAAFSGAYAVHSRIAELRRRGHTIENRIEQRYDGTRLSWYRLVEEVAA